MPELELYVDAQDDINHAIDTAHVLFFFLL